MALTQASEGGLKISNEGTNGQFLQKQSGNTGGLTWATVSSGTNVGGSNGVDFNDDVYIRLGTGNDLKIWHNAGANSYIRNESGNLLIEANGAGDDAIEIIPDGAVKLFYDGTQKLTTTNIGIEVSGQVHINDNSKFSCGDSADFQIYHDGTNSYVNNSTGDLYIQSISGGDDVYIWSQDDIYLMPQNGENGIKILGDGAVELYHNNVKNFETEGSGIKVLGPEGGSSFIYIHADQGDDNADKYHLQVDQDGTGFYIKNEVSGSTEVNLRALGNNTTELYYDNSKKFETDANGVTITGQCAVTSHVAWPDHSSGYVGKAVFGGGDDLQIYHDGTASYIDETGTGSLIIQSNTVQINNAAGTEVQAKFIEDGAVELYHNNSKVFETLGNGVRAQGGIMFGSDTADANRITDYEQGTFTPTICANGSTTGQVNGTGSYVKIGKQVHVHINIGNKTLTSLPTGDIAIKGLPFTVNQSNGDEFGMSSKIVVMGVDNNANNGYFRTQDNTTQALGYYNQNNSVWAQWSTTDWNNSGVYCIFNLTYFTNS